ncbi:hypothetical protein OIE61_37690 [Streptomyces sp. NBC_01762]|uniref:hypothetical protein n=1 Tax=unclassified Streptomyces TaxID=2593676 RepID=UPI002DDC3B7B|nr:MULTISPECIES: hypothetical protein [unclassified Streptomyces]WSC49204.1 hypothetical protein OIE61_37690 [Streptomyces sp. NBC_01762]WSJ49129.1 hypothetical protein OG243_05855 [Streptomyces sp. NBC_01318]
MHRTQTQSQAEAQTEAQGRPRTLVRHSGSVTTGGSTGGGSTGGSSSTGGGTTGAGSSGSSGGGGSSSQEGARFGQSCSPVGATATTVDGRPAKCCMGKDGLARWGYYSG